MADRRLSEAEIEAALAQVAAQQTPDPAFRDRLRDRLIADAAKHRATAADAAPSSRSPEARPGLGRYRLNRRQVAASALVFAAAAAGTWALVPRPAVLPPMPSPSVTFPGETAIHLRAPGGRRVAAAIAVPRAGSSTLVRLELRDGAEVAYEPTPRPRLKLEMGFVRVAVAEDAPHPLVVRASDHEALLESGAEAAFELSHPRQGGKSMRTLWLVPASAASGAALTLAVLVVQGKVAFGNGAGALPSPPPPPAGEVMVLNADRAAPGGGPHRVADLEQKVQALRQENGRLAGQLARSKGVTTESVLERIATLKRTSLAGLLAPAAIADIVTDLKGLGDEGIRAMIKLLESPDEKERFLAANLLEQLNAPAAIPALRKVALKDKDKMASIMASHALAFVDDPDSVPALREIAEGNRSWESRVNALWGLCKHGDQKAIAESLAIMQDEKQPAELRGALGGNLLLLHDPELLPIVNETVRQFGKMEQVGVLAVEYYKTVATAEARTQLEAMAADAKLPDPVRKAASAALTGKAP